MPCAFEFRFSSLDNVIDLDVKLHLAVRDDTGAIVVRDSLELNERECFRWRQALTPGDYTLVGSTDWGGVIEHSITVAAGQPLFAATVPIETGSK